MKLRVGNLRQLLYWMEERQRIYLHRQAGDPWPWTKDPILQRYRFCNTYREQDRETVWLRENWLRPYKDHPNLWFAACLFRQINWSSTLAEIGFPEEWNAKRVLKILQSRKARGEKIYTSAYLIPSRGEKEKIRYTVKRVLTPLWKTVEKSGLPLFERIQDAHAWLKTFYGFGPFLAYEVASDWRHTRYLCNAKDIYTWANPGPGAKRGICRLLQKDLRLPLPRSEQLRYMQEAYQWILERRNVTILPTLEMRDIEHSMCEYDKHCRAQDRSKAGREVGLEKFQFVRRLL